MPYAVILDTVSIQRFIFSTNNLKENLGASRIVDWIYKDPLIEAIQSIYPQFSNYNYTSWHEKPDEILTMNGSDVEIGYIGGGNALILFKQLNAAEDFVKLWSRNLLVKSPSLIPSASIGEIDLSGDNFSKTLSQLFEKLAKNKSEFIPITTLQRHGITAECARTGLSREIWSDNLLPQADYISCVAYAKLSHAEVSEREHENLLKEIGLSSDFCFTNQFDQLGQKRGEENYIAIVHIDGNDMGSRFRESKTLPELRKLSKTVTTATRDSLKEMLISIINKMPEIEKESGIFEIKKEKGKKVLPIRPILIGGDDITFVCEGHLGIWLAKVFLGNFSAKKVSDNKPLSACAGVSITKTKYPFYRGYQIAEELLRNAKRIRKEGRDSGCWIDFHLTYGGISGNLEHIRKTQFELPQCNLLMRPYKLEDLHKILEAVKSLNKKNDEGKYIFSRTKLHKIREALYSSQAHQEKLIEDFRAKGIRLPSYGESFEGNRLVSGRQTPYFDMLELLEFYPEILLREEKNEKVYC